MELFDRAVNLAASVTNTSKIEDLDNAFSGQARNAFLWLQDYLSNDAELEWCYTRGCPACVVEHSLHSESSVKMLFVACLLSDVHYPFTFEGPTLPSFTFFLDSLSRALVEDPLYDNNFFELTQPKALSTRNGIEDLIHRCCELEVVLGQALSSRSLATTPPTAQASPVLKTSGANPSSARLRQVLSSETSGANPSSARACPNVTGSNMTQRQMKLQIEKEQWEGEMLERFYGELQAPAQARVVPLQNQSLKAKLKDEPSVVIKEIDPGD